MNPQSSTVRSIAKRARRPRIQRWLSTLGGRRITPATIIMVVVGALFFYNFINQVVRQAQLEQLQAETLATVAGLEAENNQLREKMQYYESDDYAELIAREQLGYARPGDTVILPTYPDRVMSDTTTIVQTGVISDTITPLTAEPNWMRWWRLLSGNP